MKMQIIGAGSAGCHMARAARREGYEVMVSDIDREAIERFMHLYHDRYGEWDDAIALTTTSGRYQEADLYYIATPPETHYDIITKLGSRRILCEKPLCLPGEEDEIPDHVMVNYNHLYSPAFLAMAGLGAMGELKQIEAHWWESVEYILKAHPWIKDPDESYLLDYRRGGGAAFEHSHGMACALALLDGEPVFDDILADQQADISTITFHVGHVRVHSSTDYREKDVIKRCTLWYDDDPTRDGAYFANIDFQGDRYDEMRWRRNGGFGSRDFRRDRNDQFLHGLRGALDPKWNTNRIAKQVVKLVGTAYGLY